MLPWLVRRKTVQFIRVFRDAALNFAAHVAIMDRNTLQLSLAVAVKLVAGQHSRPTLAETLAPV